MGRNASAVPTAKPVLPEKAALPAATVIANNKKSGSLKEGGSVFLLFGKQNGKGFFVAVDGVGGQGRGFALLAEKDAVQAERSGVSGGGQPAFP